MVNRLSIFLPPSALFSQSVFFFFYSLFRHRQRAHVILFHFLTLPVLSVFSGHQPSFLFLRHIKM